MSFFYLPSRRYIVAFIALRCWEIRFVIEIPEKAGMNPKTLQYLMGHSDISVTLNTYTHWDFEDAKSDFQKIQNGKW